MEVLAAMEEVLGEAHCERLETSKKYKVALSWRKSCDHILVFYKYLSPEIVLCLVICSESKDWPTLELV